MNNVDAPKITQVSQVPSLGIEDALFQEDDTAKLLPVLEYGLAYGGNSSKNPIEADTLANLLR